MANRAGLTVAAICSATLARADTFAERWPAPSAVDPVRVAQAPAAEPPEKVRQAVACHRIYFTQNKHRYWAASDETSGRASIIAAAACALSQLWSRTRPRTPPRRHSP